VTTQKDEDDLSAIEEQVQRFIGLAVARAAQATCAEMAKLPKDMSWKAMHEMSMIALLQPDLPAPVRAQAKLMVLKFLAHQGDFEKMHRCLGQSIDSLRDDGLSTDKHQEDHHVH
jgi:hypothetical protein